MSLLFAKLVMEAKIKAEFTYFHCGDTLIKTLQNEISEVEKVAANVKWEKEFCFNTNDNKADHQTAYNKYLYRNSRKWDGNCNRL